MPKEAAMSAHAVPVLPERLKNDEQKMEIACQLQQELVASAGQRNFLNVSNIKRDTGSVFGIRKDAQTCTARYENIIPPKAFGQTSVLCGVAA